MTGSYYFFDQLDNRKTKNRQKHNKKKLQQAKQSKQNKTKQNKTKQNKTKQNKTKQNKTKQNITKQNRIKQKRTKIIVCFLFSLYYRKAIKTMEQRQAVTYILYYIEEYVAFIFKSIIIDYIQKKGKIQARNAS